MSQLPILLYEFFKIGLFAVGGGLAALPFLYDLSKHYDWLPAEMLPDMIAVSESTPGPIGVNIATYAGYNAFGVLGGILATLALILPSIIISLIVANFLAKFNENSLVQSAFTGLRPAVTGLIAAAFWQMLVISLFHMDLYQASGRLGDLIDIRSIIFFGLIFFALLKWEKHPILYISVAAVAGMIFKF